jgi:hypothetical protein
MVARAAGSGGADATVPEAEPDELAGPYATADLIVSGCDLLEGRRSHLHEQPKT